MGTLKVKTGYTTESSASMQNIFFYCHPDDFSSCFQKITDEILEKHTCRIWYVDPNESNSLVQAAELVAVLGFARAFVIPVTSNFLMKDTFAYTELFPCAEKKHIPILPLMQEEGLVDLFNKKCGHMQYLSRLETDPSGLSYDQKLEKFLNSVLIGGSDMDKIRKEFDAYIFLSYRKKDREYAKKLMHQIHQNPFCRDIAIWYDEFLTPGEDFNDEIEEALKKSAVFAMAVTPNLVNEKNYIMQTEYPLAVQEKKLIFPAEVVKTDRALLEKYYSQLPPCEDPNDNKKFSARLLEMVQSLALPENDRLPEHNYLIGLAYLYGIDVEVDYDRALELITGAAEQGCILAILKLRTVYRNGIGVKPDEKTAIHWMEKAVEYYSRTCKTAGSADERQNAARELVYLYMDIGWSWFNLYEQDRSELAFMEAQNFLEQFLANEQDMEKKTREWLQSQLAVIYRGLGNIQDRRGDIRGAQEYYQRAFALCTEMEKTSKLLNVLIQRAECCDELGELAIRECDYESADRYFTENVQTRKRICGYYSTDKNTLLLAKAYYRRGEQMLYARRFADAEKEIATGLRICEQLMQNVNADRSVREAYYSGMDLCVSMFRMQGNIGKAEQCGSIALDYRKKEYEKEKTVFNRTCYARALLGMAFAEVGKGNTAMSKKYGLEAYRLYDELNRELELPISMSNLGDCCIVLISVYTIEQNGHEAEKFCNRAVDLYREAYRQSPSVERLNELARALSTRSSVGAINENFEQALADGEEAIAIHQKIYDRVEKDVHGSDAAVQLLHAYGSMLDFCTQHSGEDEKGGEYSRRSVEFAEQLYRDAPTDGNTLELMMVYFRVANFYWGLFIDSDDEIKMEESLAMVKKYSELTVQYSNATNAALYLAQRTTAYLYLSVCADEEGDEEKSAAYRKLAEEAAEKGGVDAVKELVAEFYADDDDFDDDFDDGDF